MFSTEIVKQVHVVNFIRILPEDDLFIIPPHHNVKRKFSGDDSFCSGHLGPISDDEKANEILSVLENRTVPFFCILRLFSGEN